MKKLKPNAPKAFKQLFTSQSVIDNASNNSRKYISDFELTDIIQHVDEHTEGNDSKFQLEFTKAVFREFGWRYFTKLELDAMDRKTSDKLYNEMTSEEWNNEPDDSDADAQWLDNKYGTND